MKMFFSTLVLVFVLIGKSSVSIAQTTVPAGNVSGTWTLAGSPYLVQGNILIPDGQTLTIEPGVTVDFQGTYKLLVLGRLLAIGTAANIITFTPANTGTGWRGIRFDSTPMTNDTSKIFYCKFEYGKAIDAFPYDRGGALYVKGFSKLVVSNCEITHCQSYNAGGGIYSESSDLIIKNSTISYNTADGGGLAAGGGIFCLIGNPSVINNTIHHNTADNDGGGINFELSLGFPNGNAVISGNVIYNNTSTSAKGGGIYGSGYFTISDNTIHDNSTVISDGGGIAISANATIVNNTIYNNMAADAGGGISCWSSSDPFIANNIICNNTAVATGGGIYFESGEPTVNGNVICNNSVTGTNGHGGGIACFTGAFSSDTGKFSNNTICNNAVTGAGGQGGGIYFRNSSSPVFSNSILFGNSASTGSTVFIYDEPSDPDFHYCLVQGGTAGFGVNGTFYLGTYQNNIDVNPMFVSPSGGSGAGFNGVTADWSLQTGSPCIDAGTPDTTGLDLYTTDIAGNFRVAGASIDMGAYENSSFAPLVADFLPSQPQSLCVGGSQQFTDNSTGSRVSWRWDFGDSDTSHLQNPTHTYDIVGSYTVTLIISDGTNYDTISKVGLINVGNNSTSGTDVQTACDSYTWIDGITYTASNNTATHTLTGANGCDSVVTLNLTINFSVNGTDVQTACDAYTWIDGVTYTASNNTATHTLTSVNGCDSVVTLNLTINAVDVSVTTSDPSITANATGVLYQWIDCDNSHAPITGETAQNFTASTNGDYAVIVTDNSCSDTSSCVTISSVGIPGNTFFNSVLFPNPNQGLINIDLGSLKEISLKIFTTLGELVYEKENINASIYQFQFNEAPGIYLVELNSQYGKQHYKLVKK